MTLALYKNVALCGTSTSELYILYNLEPCSILSLYVHLDYTQFDPSWLNVCLFLVTLYIVWLIHITSSSSIETFRPNSRIPRASLAF